MTEYREGADTATVRKLPGLRKYSNLTFKRGYTQNKELWDWRKTVVDGKTERIPLRKIETVWVPQTSISLISRVLSLLIFWIRFFDISESLNSSMYFNDIILNLYKNERRTSNAQHRTSNNDVATLLDLKITEVFFQC